MCVTSLVLLLINVRLMVSCLNITCLVVCQSSAYCALLTRKIYLQNKLRFHLVLLANKVPNKVCCLPTWIRILNWVFYGTRVSSSHCLYKRLWWSFSFRTISLISWHFFTKSTSLPQSRNSWPHSSNMDHTNIYFLENLGHSWRGISLCWSCD